MEFKDAMKCVADVLSATGTEIKSNYYDGIVVKKLEASNTLDEGRTTNQTHIAFTGLQMDIFPYLKADGYFDAETGDQTLKKYFVERIPVCLQETNIEYLGTQDANLNINFTNGKCEGVTSVIRSKRENQADQIQVSLKQYDSPEFIDFRKMLHVGTYLIILKKEKQFFYDVFGVLAGDGGQLNDLNNKFFKKTTSTIIDVAKFKYEIEDETKDNGNNEHKGANILLYGIPGSGKSFRANKLAHTKEHPERVTHVVFHPEYSYQDFMGQIMPELKEVEVDGAGDTDTPIHKKALSYSFIPGPFTIALSKAYADPNNPYYLIIDEINRGNAPAIFGEAFQLLDRNRRTKASEYGVDNHEVAEKIYADLNLEQKNRLGDKVFIPGNLTIIATMNTGDQNVFRLDTAFSRRWSKELVRNQFESAEEDTEEEKEYLCNLSNTILLKEEPNVSTLNPHNITWKKFAQSINKKINDLNQNGDFSEDKGLGTFFVVPEECKKAKAFGEKVLMYLWYDVFRYGNKTDIFEQPRASFEFMMDAFEKEGLNIFKENIFANIQEHAGTTATLPGATDTHNQDGE